MISKSLTNISYLIFISCFQWRRWLIWVFYLYQLKPKRRNCLWQGSLALCNVHTTQTATVCVWVNIGSHLVKVRYLVLTFLHQALFERKLCSPPHYLLAHNRDAMNANKNQAAENTPMLAPVIEQAKFHWKCFITSQLLYHWRSFQQSRIFWAEPTVNEISEVLKEKNVRGEYLKQIS